MSYADTVASRPTTDHQSALMHEHPRGRGFSILSRLAREQEAPAATAAPHAAPESAAEPAQETAPPAAPQAEAQVDAEEWTAPVIPLDRPTPAPRHRRDDADAESARRSS